MSYPLTKNGVQLLRNGYCNAQSPVDVQIISLEELRSAGQARYRVFLSDGEEIISGILEQKLNDQVKSGEISKRVVIRINSSQSKQIKDNQVIIVIYEIERLTEPLEGNIGNPQKSATRQAAPGGASNQANNNKAPAGNDSIYTPIKRLHPYIGNAKWTIKASVMNKPDQMKNWSKDGREGVLFSVDLHDNDGGEIRATLFNDVAKKFWEVLQKDKTYLISKAKIKGANKQFSQLNSDYELTFDDNTTCDPCAEDEQIQIHYNFIESLAQIETMGKDQSVDVLAIVKETGDVTSQTSKKTNREMRKRNITILDGNSVTISLTLWDDKADYPGWAVGDHPVLAIKGCRISEYNGKTLSLPKNARMEIDPPLDAAYILRNWYESQGGEIKTKDLSSVSNQKWGGEKSSFNYTKANIADITAPGYYEIKAYIVSISDKSPFYPSCKECKRKVEVDSNGDWFCNSCDAKRDCVYNYTLRFMVSDQTSHKFVSIFGDLGKLILGRDADEMAGLRESNVEEFNAILKSRVFDQWRLSVKVDFDNNPSQTTNELRFRANRMERISAGDNGEGFRKETAFLLNELSMLAL
eukprot:TRINITY_DN12830_c0_g1_i1.p1 TRINITY_DN12830_c0_g1~~TRINITY_DN12830_c0_g1_i1.p1  ORF type:complete len:602 (+),score=160.10 TRINITY_DN12830_c0_g1_i1:61-1806(+)